MAEGTRPPRTDAGALSVNDVAKMISDSLSLHDFLNFRSVLHDTREASQLTSSECESRVSNDYDWAQIICSGNEGYMLCKNEDRAYEGAFKNIE